VGLFPPLVVVTALNCAPVAVVPGRVFADPGALSRTQLSTLYSIDLRRRFSALQRKMCSLRARTCRENPGVERKVDPHGRRSGCRLQPTKLVESANRYAREMVLGHPHFARLSKNGPNPTSGEGEGEGERKGLHLEDHLRAFLPVPLFLLLSRGLLRLLLLPPVGAIVQRERTHQYSKKTSGRLKGATSANTLTHTSLRRQPDTSWCFALVSTNLRAATQETMLTLR